MVFPSSAFHNRKYRLKFNQFNQYLFGMQLPTSRIFWISSIPFIFKAHETTAFHAIKPQPSLVISLNRGQAHYQLITFLGKGRSIPRAHRLHLSPNVKEVESQQRTYWFQPDGMYGSMNRYISTTNKMEVGFNVFFPNLSPGPFWYLHRCGNQDVRITVHAKWVQWSGPGSQPVKFLWNLQTGTLLVVPLNINSVYIHLSLAEFHWLRREDRLLVIPVSIFTTIHWWSIVNKNPR